MLGQSNEPLVILRQRKGFLATRVPGSGRDDGHGLAIGRVDGQFLTQTVLSTVIGEVRELDGAYWCCRGRTGPEANRSERQDGRQGPRVESDVNIVNGTGVLVASGRYAFESPDHAAALTSASAVNVVVGYDAS
jgi:hypothetical protein